MWIATDGSINRFDYKRRQFIHYNIIDKSHSRNANWAYSILEDNQGRLWIATFLGGIFAVDKHKLIESREPFCEADLNYIQGQSDKSISDNFVSQILLDHLGNIWALCINNNQVNKININTGKVTRLFAQDKSVPIHCMLCDEQGFIWLGIDGQVIKIDPVTGKRVILSHPEMKGSTTRFLTEENDRIWINTSAGTFVAKKKLRKITSNDISNKPYFCGYYEFDRANIIFWKC